MRSMCRRAPSRSPRASSATPTRRSPIGPSAGSVDVAAQVQNLSATASCACRKSNPNILVVQPAQDRAAKNGPGQFDGARDRRILLQRQMRPYLVVIFHVRQQYMTEVSLAEHNNVVKALPSDRTDQPFGISVLPWGARRCRPVTNAH